MPRSSAPARLDQKLWSSGLPNRLRSTADRFKRTLQHVPRARSDDYDEKRNNILRHAAALFARLGFARTSTAALAKRCRISKALLYHYYASKETLLFDLLDTYTTEFVDTVLDAAKARVTAEERLRTAIKRLTHFCTAERDRHIVMLNETQILPPAQQARLLAAQHRVVTAIADLILEINPRLDRGQEINTPLALSVLGMINWTYRWFRPNGPMTSDEFAEMATDVFVNGIRGMTTESAGQSLAKQGKGR